jgi:hypothetical protein
MATEFTLRRWTAGPMTQVIAAGGSVALWEARAA